MKNYKFIQLITDRLDKIIDYKGIRIKEISQKSGISESQIYKILSGTSDTTLKTLFEILNAIDTPIEVLFNFNIPFEKKYSNLSTFESHNKMLKCVAENLKKQQYKLFRSQSITQQKIADNMGYCTYKYIGYLFNGRNNLYLNMKISTLYNIAEELKIENKIYELFKI